MPWNIKKRRIYLNTSLILRKYISEWTHKKEFLSSLLSESLSIPYHPNM